MKQKSILLVEDEAITAQSIQLELQSKGYQVIIAGSSDKAINAVKSSIPDVIIMDIHLAGNKDGIETMRSINEIKNIPVIFMTGYHDELLIERTKELNLIDIIIKPINLEDVYKMLNKNIL